MNQIKFGFKGLQVEIYKADRIAHDEPASLAWEVTCPAAERPHMPVMWSTKDYSFDYNGFQAALQDVMDNISAVI